MTDTAPSLPPGLTPEWLADLRCPLGLAPLRWDAAGERLVCTRCGLRFRFDAELGFPDLVVGDTSELPNGVSRIDELACHDLPRGTAP